MKKIIGLLILSFLYISCSEKIRDNRVEYKVTLVPYAGQTNYSTTVEYTDSDNTTKKITVTKYEWIYTFNAPTEFMTSLKATNNSGASSMIISININNGGADTRQCDSSNCTIQLNKRIQ